MAFDESKYTKIKGFTVPKSFRPAEKTAEAKEWFYGRTILPAAIGYMRFQGLDITVGRREHAVDGGAMVAVNTPGTSTSSTAASRRSSTAAAWCGSWPEGDLRQQDRHR